MESPTSILPTSVVTSPIAGTDPAMSPTLVDFNPVNTVSSPLKCLEILDLASIGVSTANLGFTTVTMESDKYICIREKVSDSHNQVVIVDMEDTMNPIRKSISADSAIMHPHKCIIALKAGKQLQVFNIESKAKVKSHLLSEDVVFWRWISPTALALVTETAVYHWPVVEGVPDAAAAATGPIKVFDRHASIAASQIINYRIDSDDRWMLLCGIYLQQKKIVGCMQLYSKERSVSQVIDGHCGAFCDLKRAAGGDSVKLFVFAVRSQTGKGRLHVVQLEHKGPSEGAFSKRAVDLPFPADMPNDFPISLHVSEKQQIIYILTKYGFVHLYDLESVAHILGSRCSTEPVFLGACATDTDQNECGLLTINRKGLVIEASLNYEFLIPFLLASGKSLDLIIELARRLRLPGAEDIFQSKFNDLLQSGHFQEAARVAASAPGTLLRTAQTIDRLKQAPVTGGSPPPLLIYFSSLLETTDETLNKQETLELAKSALLQGKKSLLERWIKEERLDCSEEFGDLIRPQDPALALSIYLRSASQSKVIGCFLELGQIKNVVAYAKKTGYAPDYSAILRTLLKSNDFEKAGEFSRILIAEDCLPLDQLFECLAVPTQVQLVTSVFLDLLKKDLPELGPFQTRLLQLQLSAKPTVADTILESKLFTRYDRSVIAKQCEEAGLIKRALENYVDSEDLKRLLVANVASLDQEWLVKFLGESLSSAKCLDCMEAILAHNVRSNQPLCVKIACSYSAQLGPQSLIALFESVRSPEMLYTYLSSVISGTSDAEVVFKYLQAACKIGQYRDVERVVRESSAYSPEKVINLLKEAKLPDQGALIAACDRFGYQRDLAIFLYQNNFFKAIENYVHRSNPSVLPIVVEALLSIDSDESQILSLIVDTPAPETYKIDQLISVLEKTGRLNLIKEWLESLTGKSNFATLYSASGFAIGAFNALAKIYVTSGSVVGVDQWLVDEGNIFDTLVIGSFCKKINPYLAFLCFQRGLHDSQLISLCDENSMFKHEAKYLVYRKDPSLWQSVLSSSNEFRDQLIDQVVATVLPECQNSDEISVVVKSFMEADLPYHLIELLEKIVLDSDTMFCDNRNLQNLLIVTAIRFSPSKVAPYLSRLSNYDSNEVALVAIDKGLFEEAFQIYVRFSFHLKALDVLFENISDLERAVEYAESVDLPDVWAHLAKAQLAVGQISKAVDSFLRAEDFSFYKEVTIAAVANNSYTDLVRFLAIARKKLRDSYLETEYLFALAMTEKLPELEELISTPSIAQLQAVGDRCFENGLFLAAKMLFNNINNYARLTATLVKLEQFQAAVDCARKANSGRVWKETCESCISHGEYKLGQICALNLILNAEELEQITQLYERLGLFDQLISLLEAGIGMERAHMGVFTELAVSYAKYREGKLLEHVKKHQNKINLPKLIKVAEGNALWNELALCHALNEEFDLAATIAMRHPVEAFEHEAFKGTILKIINLEIYYKALRFYLEEHPLLINDLLSVISARADMSRVVQMFQKCGQISLIRQSLVNFSQVNNPHVNNALIDLLLEEESFEELLNFTERTEAFDQLGLAARLEKHESYEFRRLASILYRKNKKYKQSLAIAKKDNCYEDAIETAAESRDSTMALDVLTLVAERDFRDYFCAATYHCYDLLKPDVVLEIAWKKSWMDIATPFFCQSLRESSQRISTLESTIASMNIGGNASGIAEDRKDSTSIN